MLRQEIRQNLRRLPLPRRKGRGPPRESISPRDCLHIRHISITVASPRKAKNPITSVKVGTKR